jgi:hypothetical protein
MSLATISPARFELAQANVAYALADHDDARLADYFARLDEMNELADRSPGFVWRYLSDSRDPRQREFDDPRVLFNLSVWSVDRRATRLHLPHGARRGVRVAEALVCGRASRGGRARARDVVGARWRATERCRRAQAPRAHHGARAERRGLRLQTPLPPPER